MVIEDHLTADGIDSPEGRAPTCESLKIQILFKKFEKNAGLYGASYYRLSRMAQPVRPRRIHGDAPDVWTEIYMERRYLPVDPAIPLAFQTTDPFTFSEVAGLRGDRLSRELWVERQRHYARDGIVVPTHGPYGEVGIVIMRCDDPIVVRPAWVAPMRQAARDYMEQVLAFEARSERRGHGVFSRRESQCVYWMSEGKSAPVIAQILGLSSHTVRQYIKSCMKKLGVNHRSQLIRQALAMGLLCSEPPP